MKDTSIDGVKPEQAPTKKRPPTEEASSDEPQPAKAKKTKRLSKKEMRKRNPGLYEFRGTIQECCRTDDLDRAIKAYEKAVQDGTTIEAPTFYNLLNLCDGLGKRGLHIGTPRPTGNTTEARQEKGDDKDTTLPNGEQNQSTNGKEPSEDPASIALESRIQYAERVKKHMDSLNLALNETAYYALEKLYSRSSRTIPLAVELLLEAETVQQCKPKLRLYVPLLESYCSSGNMQAALEIWRKLADQKLVPLENQYRVLMQCATMQPERHNVAPVMERVLADLAEDVLVPSKETYRAICEWFQSPHAVISGQVFDGTSEKESGSDNTSRDNTFQDLISNIHVPYPEPATSMGPVQCAESDGWEISSGVRVDSDGTLLGGCLRGACLQPVSLSDNSWELLRALNGEIAIKGRLQDHKSPYQGGRKGPIRKVDSVEERQFHWKTFEDYVDKRNEKKKIDVVIDGANVGYFGKSSGGKPKHVNYNQIDWVIDHFRKQNKSVLMVIHSRHFARNFMPRYAVPLLRKWIDNDVLYRTPPGMNDDVFWMHVALKTGPGTLVVTNDEMRDHHFQMQSPRYFLRWKDRHQVHFDFAEERDRAQKDGTRTSQSRGVVLHPPESYSRRIQRVSDGLVIPLPKKGDERRFLDGSFMAEEEGTPEEETYVCIRPKRTVRSADP